MAETIILRHEYVHDIPIILGTANQLGLAGILNRHLGTHGLQQGLHNGELAVGWLGYILSQGDHRKSAVQEWANDRPHTLEGLLGRPIRTVEFNDDRLGGVLHRLSDDAAWAAIEQDLWAATVEVYDLPLTGVRLDSTTSYGYHQPQEEGLMQYGQSKDHRPDLPQLKLMAAAAEPWGHLIACDVKPGQRADDPLYTPLLQRVRTILGQSGLLYTGDSKMAALATRAEIAAQQDYYLVPLPRTGETAQVWDAWIDAVVVGEQAATLVWDGARLLGAGYELERRQTATVDGQAVTWTERVQVVRSQALAQQHQRALEQRLTTAQGAVAALTPEPGRGKRQIRDEAALQTALTRVLEQPQGSGLLTVTWERQETETTRYQGRGRGGANRPTVTERQVRFAITGVSRNDAAVAAHQARLGWQVRATNAPAERLSLPQAVLHYRGGWCLERDFHLVKDLPLGLSPLFVWKDDQIKGLTRLLTLGLRLWTLIEGQVRQAVAQDAEPLTGLYEGQPRRQAERPTAQRILKAFVRAPLTLTQLQTGARLTWHLTPLTPLQARLLRYLKLPPSLYTALAHNSS